MTDIQKYRSPLVEPLHHGIINNIDPWWKKLLINILVPIFFQSAHVEEAIVLCHLSIGKTKITDNGNKLTVVLQLSVYTCSQ